MTVTPTITGPRALSRQPHFRPPQGAWDSHCHVFGPGTVFPYAEKRSYTPPDIPVQRLIALHEALGFDHAVLVQPAAHGADHGALLDALNRSNGHYRGVMLVNNDGADLQVDALHRQGIRAIRYNLMPHLGDMPDMGHVRSVVSRIAGAGWHICLHLTPAYFDRVGTWLELGVPLLIDHMGRLDLTGPAELDVLIALLVHPNAFIKLSAADRLSRHGAPYDDAIAVARRLLETAPEKCLWGTDFPHPNHTAVPDDAMLVDLIPRIAHSREEQHQLLVTNPARLYR